MEPDPLTTRTGGAYIPPARLRMMQEGITDKASVAYQRIAWEALKKSINGLVNKVRAVSFQTRKRVWDTEGLLSQHLCNNKHHVDFSSDD